MVAGGALAFSFAARWSCADWLSTQTNVGSRQRATRLVSSDARLWLRLADLVSVDGEDVRPLLKKALVCSPADASIWIRLSLESEAFRDYPEAERCLLRAAELDGDVIPAWSLANFYFRRGNKDGFFHAAKRVLVFSRGDLTPIFHMAWALIPDSGPLLQEGLLETSRPSIAYLNWLVSSDLLDAADAVARNVLNRFPHEGKIALLGYCDRLIATSRPRAAIALWSAMNTKGLLSTGPVHINKILNGTFGSASLNSGFDWHLASLDGIEVMPKDPGLWVEFGRSQRDRFEVASQILLLARGASHQLRYNIQRSGVEAGLGLRWAMADLRNGDTISQSSDFSTDADTWVFSLPVRDAFPDADLFRLVLVYERPPASPLGNGWVRIDFVSLDSLK
jgi:hypothetical protein